MSLIGELLAALLRKGYINTVTVLDNYTDIYYNHPALYGLTHIHPADTPWLPTL
jgi:hypothetical protein